MIAKTIQIGTSVAVIIPKQTCKEMNITLGDYVSVTINKKIEE